jgi:DNA-binding CsgD family transcriptional regulator
MGEPPEELVDQVYEAAVLSELWPAVLEALSKHYGVAAAGLVLRGENRWLGWRTSPAIADAAERYLREADSLATQTTPRLVAADHPGFLTEADLFTEAEYRQDPFFTAFLAPNGFGSGAATAVPLPLGDFAVVQVLRRQGERRLSSAEVSRLDELRPHLARAALLAARWRLEKLQAMAHALGSIGLAAAVIDAGGRALAVSPQFQAQSRYVRWRGGDQFVLIDGRAQAVLATALRKLHVAGALAAQSFAVQGGEPRDVAVAHLTPIAGQARDIFSDGVALLTLAALGGVGLKPALIQGLFDLTPTEAKIAVGLLEGRSVSEMTARERVSEHTVRVHVKSVLAKAGVRRQAEFVALLRTAGPG